MKAVVIVNALARDGALFDPSIDRALRGVQEFGRVMDCQLHRVALARERFMGQEVAVVVA
jgi:hypothetical protein